MSKHNSKLTAMTQGGKMLAEVKKEIVSEIIVGKKLIEIDQKVETLIINKGAEPAFKRVPGYDWSTCINVNHGVVHGIPDQYQIKDGDLVSVDLGIYYQGYNTDTSFTIYVGSPHSEVKHFLDTGKKSLTQAIKAAKVGNRVWDVSNAMQKVVEKAGYSVATNLTGHGIGKQLHEKPSIPCFTYGDQSQSPILTDGQTVAIEVIYMMGNPKLVTEADGWTISTQDGKMAALFEDTVAITKSGPIILTK